MAIHWTEVSRKNERTGVDIMIQFLGDIETTAAFHFMLPNPSLAHITAKMNRIIKHMKFRLNPFNDMEVDGVRLRKIFKVVVPYVRLTPDVTLPDLAIVIDTDFPKLRWKPDKLLKYIIKEQGIKFSRFKKICKNKKWAGVD